MRGCAGYTSKLQPLRPLRGRAFQCPFQEALHRFATIRDDRQCDVSNATNLLTRNVHLNDLNIGRNDHVALAAGEQPQARAQDQYEIRPFPFEQFQRAEGHHVAAKQRMVWGHDSIGLVVTEYGRVQSLGKLRNVFRRVRETGTATDQNYRLLR